MNCAVLQNCLFHFLWSHPVTLQCSRICWPTCSEISFTLRSTSRVFDTLENLEFCRRPFTPSSSLPHFYFIFLREPLQGPGLQEKSDTINLQSKWHNQRLHKSYQHSQAPGRLLRWQFHGSPPERHLPISREWQIAESRYSALSHRWFRMRGLFSKWNCNDLKITCLHL